MTPFRLDNEIALITGGATGLGFGIARCMTEAGARCVLVGRREAPLREAAEKLGGGASYFCHDVTRLEAAPALAEQVTAQGGAPTILVNNAGIHVKKAALDTSDAEFLSVLQTHVLGAFALTRAVSPGMLSRGSGSILFISSMAAFMGIPQVTAYAAAKSAITGMIRTLATELSPKGIRVNGIAPGWINTGMMQGAFKGDPEREQKILGRTPMACFGDPGDVGNAAVYLASPAAKFVTGTLLTVDGGVSIGF